MKTRHSLATRSFLTLTGSLVMSAVVSATPAFAQDEASGSDSANGEAATAEKAGTPPAAPAPESVAPAPAAAKPVAPSVSPAAEMAITSVGVERLRPSAYPEQPVRGIKGGSMALTFHGLQWPYMPATAGGTRFVLGLSGWVWDDISYAKYKASDNNSNKPTLNQKKTVNQGRFVFRATPTWTFGDWFVQGQGEFVATTNQDINRGGYGGADTDDLWLRIGQWNFADVQVGRFEGWEVFHLGMGLDLNTYERNGAKDDANIVEYYGLTDLQYRSSTAGNVAFHLYPMDFLRFEILGQVGSTDAQNSYGGRAVGIFDLGWFKLKAGAEYRKKKDALESSKGNGVSKGVAASAQFVPHPWFECGVNFAQGYQDTWDKSGQHKFTASFDRQSIGAFANGRLYFEDLILGLGVINSTKRDIYKDAGNVDPDANNELSHLQSFAALQYAIFQQFYVKVVGNYAKSKTSIPNAGVEGKDIAKYKTFDLKEYGVRVRFSYFF